MAALQRDAHARHTRPTRPRSRARPAQECLSGGELFEHLLAKGPFKEDYALAIFAQARPCPAPGHPATRRHSARSAPPEAACTGQHRPLLPQVCLAVEYLHSVDVVHRDLKAENIVFAAKGSPVIKFIDFGGACTWAQEEGLTGLVGTPQYVAPEVVTGFGEDKPTDTPYGKGCAIRD